MVADRAKLLANLANALWTTWGERTRQPHNGALEVLDDHISRAIVHAGFSIYELNQALNTAMASATEIPLK